MNDGVDNPLGRVYTRDELAALLEAFEGQEFHVNKLGPDELGLWRPSLGRLTRAVPARAVSALAQRAGWNLYCKARKAA
jgi:hypothetical protein